MKVTGELGTMASAAARARLSTKPSARSAIPPGYADDREAIKPASFGRLCRARDILREVQEPSQTIHEVASAVGISPYHFIRQFEALFGATPYQFRIASPEGPDDRELVLEPNANPAGKTFQEALFRQGIPATAFEVATSPRSSRA